MKPGTGQIHGCVLGEDAQKGMEKTERAISQKPLAKEDLSI